MVGYKQVRLRKVREDVLSYIAKVPAPWYRVLIFAHFTKYSYSIDSATSGHHLRYTGPTGYRK